MREGGSVMPHRWWWWWCHSEGQQVVVGVASAVCCVTPNRTASGGQGSVGPGRLAVFAVRVLLWWW